MMRFAVLPMFDLRSCVLSATTLALQRHLRNPAGYPMTVTILRTTAMLALSNVFMTFAWYAHLKNLSAKPWYIAALASWGIAVLEYAVQVPANRLGYTVMSLPQLKMLQEAIALAVFVPFAVFYMKQPIKLDYLWASLCVMGALYFMFRSHT